MTMLLYRIVWPYCTCLNDVVTVTTFYFDVMRGLDGGDGDGAPAAHLLRASDFTIIIIDCFDFEGSDHEQPL